MSETPPPAPQLSPDGKFFWDGAKWVPMPAPAAPQVVRIKGKVTTGAAGWRYWFWGLLVGGILLFVVWSSCSYSAR